MTLRDQILSSNDLVYEVVDIPEWGVSVRVYVMSGIERDRIDSFLSSITKNKNLDHVRSALAIATVRDDNGKPIFGPADLEALSQKSSAALDRIFAVAQRINKLSDQDVQDLKKN